MPLSVRVLGVHRVKDAAEPCHLVEIEVNGEGEFDVGAITQSLAGVPEAEWQVPYDEHELGGDIGPATPIDVPGPIQVVGSIRIAFFFHYLALDEALRTPAGQVALPAVTARPAHLRFLTYEAP